jgi:FecR protein
MNQRIARWTLALLLAGAASVSAQEGSPTPDTGITQTVARISYIEGNVSYARGDEPDQWQGADQNVPMTTGDRLYTDQGSLELQLEGGSAVELGPQTDLTALNLGEGIQQFAVKSGTSAFSVPRLPAGTTFEVDTPNAAVTFDRPGTYRVDVDESGQTRLSVRSGSAILAAGGGQIAVSSGEAIAIEGVDTPRYEVLPLPAADRFDGWVESRTIRAPRGPSYQYVSAGVVGAGDLDQYGTWQTVAGYGNVWSPRSVPIGWSPYTLGHWTWQDPWGWTWISTEPWGWAPYHYGRWVTASSQWYWVPVAPAVQTVAYAPALVAFVGGGPGYGATVAVSTGLVGWFPLAPRDPLVPWWGVRPAVNVNVTNVTYVNRTYVTVVNQTTFVSGAPVSAGVIREQSAVRQVASAPVVVGRVPVAPTAASTRVSVRQTAPAPPAAVVSRAVVTRSVPPPAPPRFEQKIATIRESRAPVMAQTTSRASATGAAPARPIIPVTSVGAPGGSVRLAPRNASAQTANRVEPVAPSTGARPGAPAARPNEPVPRPGEMAARPSNDQRPTPGIAVRPPVGAAGAAPAPRGVPTARINERKEEPAAEHAPVRPAPGYPSNRPPDTMVHTPGPPARATSEEQGQTRNPRAVPPTETREHASQQSTQRPETQRRAPTAVHPTPHAQPERGQPAPPEARGERAQQPPEPRSEAGTASKPRPTPQRPHGAPEKPTPEPHSD